MLVSPSERLDLLSAYLRELQTIQREKKDQNILPLPRILFLSANSLKL